MAGSVRVSASGPFFNGSVPRIIALESEAILQNVGEIAVRRLQKDLQPAPEGVLMAVTSADRGKASQGNYRKNLHAQVDGSLGIAIHDSGVVYGPWLEGTSSRNQTTRFKGYATFRKVRDWLEKTAIPKAILQYETILARRLNG